MSTLKPLQNQNEASVKHVHGVCESKGWPEDFSADVVLNVLSALLKQNAGNVLCNNNTANKSPHNMIFKTQKRSKTAIINSNHHIRKQIKQIMRYFTWRQSNFLSWCMKLKFILLIFQRKNIYNDDQDIKILRQMKYLILERKILF